ncbi:MAG: 4-hydroxy-3-methylbut-2-enyl diphosphate reductase [Candidatus Omnitrophota bacterium]
MKINLAKSAGFCFGVTRAVNIALKISKGKQSVYMLGDIVHNEDVVKMLARRGIKKVKGLSKNKKGIFLISAHGIKLELLNKAKHDGYKIVDATCPMVKGIHKIVTRMDNQGRKIIIIGDRNHAEVVGIGGQIKNKPVIIEKFDQINREGIDNIKKAAVVVQSTQDTEKIFKIKKALEKKIGDLKFFNTICAPTRVKQAEIRTLPKKNNLIIVIGSRKSANTKRLFQIAKSLNPNTRWINTKSEIKKHWLKNIKSIGVTAGASTPFDNIDSIIKHLKNLSGRFS